MGQEHVIKGEFEWKKKFTFTVTFLLITYQYEIRKQLFALGILDTFSKIFERSILSLKNLLE